MVTSPTRILNSLINLFNNSIPLNCSNSIISSNFKILARKPPNSLFRTKSILLCPRSDRVLAMTV